MIFHDFPRFLGKSGVYLIQPPKICARLLSGVPWQRSEQKRQLRHSFGPLCHLEGSRGPAWVPRVPEAHWTLSSKLGIVHRRQTRVEGHMRRHASGPGCQTSQRENHENQCEALIKKRVFKVFHDL